MDPSPFYAITGAFVGLIEGFYSQLLQILSSRTSLSSKAANDAPKPHVAIAYKKKRTVKPIPPINPPTSTTTANPKNTAEPITPPTMTPVPSTTKVSEALDGAPNDNAQKKKKRRSRKKTTANGSASTTNSTNNKSVPRAQL